MGITSLWFCGFDVVLVFCVTIQAFELLHNQSRQAMFAEFYLLFLSISLNKDFFLFFYCSTGLH